MQTFELNRRIPSCFVDKALVQALEDYLRHRMAQRPDTSEGPEDTEWMRIEITHDAGRQTVRSMAEHPRPTFVDGTHEIAIIFQVQRPQPLEIRLQFSANRSDSFVRVRHSGDESREFLLDLIDGVGRIVGRKRTWNSWFCPGFGLSGLVDGLAVGVVMFAIYAFTAGSRVPRWAIWTALLLPAYRLIGFCKPYSAFETPEARTLRALGNLLTAGIGGLVLVTAIGAYFDIEWLGF